MNGVSGEKMIIVDLDGTLYNSTQRSNFIEAKDWDGFHENSIHDEPNSDVVTLLQTLDVGAGGDWLFVAITGRNERFRHITLQWLAKHKVPIDSIWMRPDDSFKPDTEVKTELIDEALAHHRMDRSDILFALDDRDKVVDHFRMIGIPTYQVRQGTY